MLLLKMDWFGMGWFGMDLFGMGWFGWTVPEQVREFQTRDWEVEMNELLLVIRFLLPSDIFKKQFPNPRKTDLVFTLLCS